MRFRQKMLLTTLLLFGLLLTAVYVLQFNHTRAYLAKQMSVNVSNTVDSLGLSLLPYLQRNEYVAAETIINAVFDGGSYQQIRLRLLNDDRELVRQHPASIAGVPDWFRQLNLFEPIQQSNVLTSGWLQLAELQVVGDSGYAYQQLWKLSSQILVGFSIAAMVVMTLLLYFMRRLFEPLLAIEARANEIAEQKFGQPLPDPQMQELTGLVRSFNAMSIRLQTLFHRQAEEAENLRQAAYQDSLTQLGNKAFFDAALEQWMADPGEGGLLFIRLDPLQQVVNGDGFSRRDQMVVMVSALLQEQQQIKPTTVIARTAMDEFALILEGYDAEQVGSLVERLDQQLNRVLAPLSAKYGQLYAIGGAIRTLDITTGGLLSRADSALHEVSLNSTCAYKLLGGDREQPPLGRMRWRELVLAAIESRTLGFQLQPVMALDGRLTMLELFSRIDHQSQHYPAVQFMPFVEEYQLGARFDRYVIERVAPHLAQQPAPVSINLSESAIGDVAFTEWLKQLLENDSKLKNMLIFELPETALVSQRGALGALCRSFRRSNVRFGFDRISQHLVQLESLAELEPTYLKVDRSLVFNAAAEDNGFVLALVRLAHDVDIELIALRIESPQQLEKLAQHSVDGYQGYINKPVNWQLT